MKLVNLTTGSLVLFLISTGAIILKSPNKDTTKTSDKTTIRSTDTKKTFVKRMSTKSRIRIPFHQRCQTCR